MKISFIGAGNMTQAFLKGLDDAFFEHEIWVSNRSQLKLDRLDDANITKTLDNHKAVKDADILILAIKPQQMFDLFEEIRSDITFAQLFNLRKRMRIIRNMQVFGGLSFFFSVLSLLLILLEQSQFAQTMFAFSVVLLLISLVLLLMELQISVNALNIQLKDFDQK